MLKGAKQKNKKGVVKNSFIKIYNSSGCICFPFRAKSKVSSNNEKGEGYLEMKKINNTLTITLEVTLTKNTTLDIAFYKGQFSFSGKQDGNLNGKFNGDW